MIKFDYTFSKLGLEEMGENTSEELESLDLEYYAFCCDLTMIINEHYFDIKWQWIPILHFSKYNYLIIFNLPKKNYDTYLFTESIDNIQYKLINENTVEINVNLHTTDIIKRVIVDYNELFSAVNLFYAKVLDDIQNKWPELLKNPYFLEDLSNFEKDLKSYK